MPKVQKLDNEVLHSIWTQQTLLIDGSVWTHGLSPLLIGVSTIQEPYTNVTT